MVNDTIDPATGFNHMQLEALRLLSMADTSSLSENQAQLIQKFIVSAKGNAALNQALKNTIDMDLKPYQLDANVVNLFRLFTEKTSGIADFMFAQAKLEKRETDQSIRLSAKELSIILALAQTKPFFDFLKSKNALKGELAVLSEKVERTITILTALDEEVKKNQPIRLGTLLFDYLAKRGRLSEKLIGPYPYLVNHLLTTHGLAPAAKSSQPMLVEEAHELNARDCLYSELFVIKLDKLLSQENRDLLSKALGPHWLDQINALYESIEREIHDNTFRQYAGMKAPVTQVSQSMLPALTPQEAHITCSEFLAKTTAVALTRLETKLKEELKNKNLAVTDKLIENPLSQQAKRQTLNTVETLSLLMKNGCVEKETMSQRPRLD